VCRPRLSEMCGRIALYEEPSRLARILGARLVEGSFAGWQPSWNVGPTDEILGVRQTSTGERELGPYRWGLVPPWVKDPKAVKSTFNARAESIATKPMFRSAFEKQRILVPVDLFYEWHRLSDKEKQPYAFRRADGEPIVIAGLREWHPDVDGEVWRTATIITTEAGPDMPIHNRQPVVLERDTWEHWLDPAVTDRDELESLLHPTAEGTLVRRPVSKDVGNIRNNGPELAEAVVLEKDSEPIESQQQLPWSEA
jgi:putative SOS response-associated peptidase YedK